jgi:hypothetical protein
VFKRCSEKGDVPPLWVSEGGLEHGNREISPDRRATSSGSHRSAHRTGRCRLSRQVFDEPDPVIGAAGSRLEAEPGGEEHVAPPGYASVTTASPDQSDLPDQRAPPLHAATYHPAEPFNIAHAGLVYHGQLRRGDIHDRVP